MKTRCAKLFGCVVFVIIGIVFSWGTRLGSPYVSFGDRNKQKICEDPVLQEEIFCLTAYGATTATEGRYWLESKQNSDHTYTVTLYVERELAGFDYGIAFSPQEVTVAEYGFTEEFENHYREQQGSVMDYYFSQGERVSSSAQYIVYGGMATEQKSYCGPLCFVTVALKGQDATVYGKINSARYEDADALMDGQVSCTLQPSVAEPTGDTQETQKEAVSGDRQESDSSKATTTEQEVSKETDARLGNGQESHGKTEEEDQGKSEENRLKKTAENNRAKTGDSCAILVYVMSVLVAGIIFWRFAQPGFLKK